MNDQPLSQNTRRWLTAMLLLHLASFVLTWVSYIPISTEWISWVKRAISVGIILCLFLLTPAGRSYRKAAFFRTGIFLCSIVSLTLSHLIVKLLFYPGQTIQVILSLLSAVFSLFACWFEYRAHGKQAPELSRGWTVFFFVSFAVALFAWVVTAVYTLIPGGIPVTAASVTSTVSFVLSKLLDAAYMILLLFTIVKTR